LETALRRLGNRIKRGIVNSLGSVINVPFFILSLGTALGRLRKAERVAVRLV